VPPKPPKTPHADLADQEITVGKEDVFLQSWHDRKRVSSSGKGLKGYGKKNNITWRRAGELVSAGTIKRFKAAFAMFFEKLVSRCE
jgi:hypothetical protein